MGVVSRWVSYYLLIMIKFTYMCAGQDNDSSECSTGDVPNIFDGDLSDHDGPYDGVTMGC